MNSQASGIVLNWYRMKKESRDSLAWIGTVDLDKKEPVHQYNVSIWIEGLNS